MSDERVVYLNHAFVPESEARISIFDHVVLFGDAVFDSMFALNGYIHKLDGHVDRLFRSAHAVKLEAPLSKAETRRLIVETTQRNRLQDAYIKCIFTRGTGKEILMDPRGCTPGVIIFARPYMHLVDQAKAEKGISVRVVSIRNIPDECRPAQVKTCNYMHHVMARMEANDAGADDAIELSIDGYVAEAPGYNVFIVWRGKLLTPGDNILEGITRESVLEIAEAEGIPYAEARLTVAHVYNADEVFFCSTSGGIFAVSKVDGRQIGDGNMGPITKRIRTSFFQRCREGWRGTAIYASAVR